VLAPAVLAKLDFVHRVAGNPPGMSTSHPVEEPDAGPAEGNSLDDTAQAQNAETVLDPDAEGTGAAEDAAAHAERIEDR
jgi:hypothetical protein